jgi:hypothetical protein
MSMPGEIPCKVATHDGKAGNADLSEFSHP